jgi:hypothetical protein
MPGFMPGIHVFFQTKHQHCRHPEVLAVFGEPRRMGHKHKRPSFETPRKRAAPQDDGGMCARPRLLSAPFGPK